MHLNIDCPFEHVQVFEIWRLRVLHTCVTSGSDIIQYLHVVSRTMYLITKNMHKVVKVWTVANVRIRSMCLSLPP
jgi:hypothetical protein